MAPLSMHSSMSIVQIPTDNATACALLSGALRARGWSTSGWAPLNGIQCYFRLSAQVYLEQSDFVALGKLTLEILKNISGGA